MTVPSITPRYLGLTNYQQTWDAMKAFTHGRDQDSPDELWVTEHPPVFTQGLNGKPEHLINPGDIPVIQIDRGGQVTFHGPGQLVIYCLLDLHHFGIGVKSLVSRLEAAVIELLGGYGISALTRAGAPGVYVAQAKIAALGLRIRKGCCYHGLSLNVDMDLEPFSRINPCGYQGLAVTQLRDFDVTPGVEQVGRDLVEKLIHHLGKDCEEKSGSTRS